jgi:hypothetical protein
MSGKKWWETGYQTSLGGFVGNSLYSHINKLLGITTGQRQKNKGEVLPLVDVRIFNSRIVPENFRNEVIFVANNYTFSQANNGIYEFVYQNKIYKLKVPYRDYVSLKNNSIVSGHLTRLGRMEINTDKDSPPKKPNGSHLDEMAYLSSISEYNAKRNDFILEEKDLGHIKADSPVDLLSISIYMIKSDIDKGGDSLKEYPIIPKEPEIINKEKYELV